MYEEEDDDTPAQYLRLTAHLQTRSLAFNTKLRAYLESNAATRDWLREQGMSEQLAQLPPQIQQRMMAQHQARLWFHDWTGAQTGQPMQSPPLRQPHFQPPGFDNGDFHPQTHHQRSATFPTPHVFPGIDFNPQHPPSANPAASPVSDEQRRRMSVPAQPSRRPSVAQQFQMSPQIPETTPTTPTRSGEQTPTPRAAETALEQRSNGEQRSPQRAHNAPWPSFGHFYFPHTDNYRPFEPAPPNDVALFRHEPPSQQSAVLDPMQQAPFQWSPEGEQAWDRSAHFSGMDQTLSPPMDKGQENDAVGDEQATVAANDFSWPSMESMVDFDFDPTAADAFSNVSHSGLPTPDGQAGDRLVDFADIKPDGLDNSAPA
ncbi:hypothetical protein BDY21DRAFT_338303 [Lineolata rhizophorae]|uniref:Uncharacterized protein n=1 Tax=Lineolata rhizophorae TaxID=578093 RepID=A0A6A6P627_9PEZI|nr:hypothetical protein BDY21DRAFT_338303 [Lineolata rhizophorae]